MNNREGFSRLESRIDHLYQVIAEMLMDKKKKRTPSKKKKLPQKNIK